MSSSRTLCVSGLCRSCNTRAEPAVSPSRCRSVAKRARRPTDRCRRHPAADVRRAPGSTARSGESCSRFASNACMWPASLVCAVSDNLAAPVPAAIRREGRVSPPSRARRRCGRTAPEMLAQIRERGFVDWRALPDHASRAAEPSWLLCLHHTSLFEGAVGVSKYATLVASGTN